MIRIKEICRQKRVEITELAKRLNVSRNTVHYYINQDEKNSVDTLIRIANALNVPLSDLFEPVEKNYITCPKCGEKLVLQQEIN